MLHPARAARASSDELVAAPLRHRSSSLLGRPHTAQRTETHLLVVVIARCKRQTCMAGPESQRASPCCDEEMRTWRRRARSRRTREGTRGGAPSVARAMSVLRTMASWYGAQSEVRRGGDDDEAQLCLGASPPSLNFALLSHKHALPLARCREQTQVGDDERLDGRLQLEQGRDERASDDEPSRDRPTCRRPAAAATCRGCPGRPAHERDEATSATSSGARACGERGGDARLPG